jgi:lincosamide nucleotidyltransferase A/C/D/E
MAAGDTTGDVAEQEALLVALAATLNAVPVRYWLMGGWAVDAHLGRVTRSHSDIDFAVVLDDRDALTEALRRHGLVRVPGAGPAGEFFEGWSCRVEITYLIETVSGDVVTPGFEHWPYVAGALLAEPVGIRGVEVPVLSIAALIDTKEHWQDHIGEPMRPHDRSDLAALRALS